MSNQSVSQEPKYSNFFYLETKILKIAGISFEKDNGLAYRLYSYMVLTVICTYVLLLPIDVYTQDFNDALDSWAMVAACGMIVLLYLGTYRKRLEIGVLLKRLEEEPFLANVKRGGEIENELVHEWLKFRRRLLIFYMGVLLCGVETQVVYSGIARFIKTDSHEWTLKYGRISIVDTSTSPNFEFLYIYVAFAINICVFSGYNIVLIISGVFYYAATQMKILQNYLKVMLDDIKEKNTEKEEIWISLNEKIKDCVVYHEAILQIIEETSDIFSETTLILFAGIFGFICMDTYRASLVPIQDIQGIATCLFEAFTGYLSAMVVCNAGGYLSHEGEQLVNAIYEVNFVGLDLRFQKSLILFLRKAQVPIVIKAGKIVELSRITNARMLRGSYSAFMMLKTVNTDDPQ